MPVRSVANPFRSVSDFRATLAAVVVIVNGVITHLGALYEMISRTMPHGLGLEPPPRPLPAADDVVDLTDEQQAVRAAPGPSRQVYRRPRADSEVQAITVVDLTRGDSPRPTRPRPRPQLVWHPSDDEA